MKERENIALVRQGYDAYRSGDLNTLLGLFSREIDWDVPEIEAIPFTGKRHGIDAVAQFFRDLDAAQAVREFMPDEFIGQDDRVVVLGHCTYTVKATGRDYSDEFCHVFRVEGGKIASFKEYDDTLRVAMAYQSEGAGLATGAGREARPSIH